MTRMNRLIKMKTDRIILLLFIPWILLFIVPFIPFYKGAEHAHKLFFVILLIQIGLIYTFSYLIIKTLKDYNLRDNVKFNLTKFRIHTLINFCIIIYLFLPVFYPAEIKAYILQITILYPVLFVSGLLRFMSISAYIVSLEQNRKAKFKEYVYTFILLIFIYGIWDIHKRIRNLISDEKTALDYAKAEK